MHQGMLNRFLDRGNIDATMADLCWPFKVTSTVLCIVDEAGLGTALIVGCMSAKQDVMWTTY